MGKVINPRPSLIVDGREVTDPMEAVMLLTNSTRNQMVQLRNEIMTKFEVLMLAIEQELPSLNQKFRSMLMEKMSFQLHQVQDAIRLAGDLEAVKGVGESIERLKSEAAEEGLEASFKLGLMEYNQHKARQEQHIKADGGGEENKE